MRYMMDYKCAHGKQGNLEEWRAIDKELVNGSIVKEVLERVQQDGNNNDYKIVDENLG